MGGRGRSGRGERQGASGRGRAAGELLLLAPSASKHSRISQSENVPAAAATAAAARGARTSMPPMAPMAPPEAE